jgi:hypothetical protein
VLGGDGEGGALEEEEGRGRRDGAEEDNAASGLVWWWGWLAGSRRAREKDGPWFRTRSSLNWGIRDSAAEVVFMPALVSMALWIEGLCCGGCLVVGLWGSFLVEQGKKVAVNARYATGVPARPKIRGWIVRG